MANKQIHQLPAVSTLAPEDQLVVSQAGSNATRRASSRQPAVPAGAAGHRPTHHRRQARRDRLGQGLRRRRRWRRRRQRRVPGGAGSAHGHSRPGRHLPAGQRDPGQAASPAVRRRPRRHGDRRPRRPRLHLQPQRRRLSGRRHVRPPTGTGPPLSGMTIRMAKGGIRAHGHEFRATNLLFAGGTAPLGQADPDGWCVDLLDANETVLREIQAGYGGGTVHRLLANGIRLGSSTPSVNYGDGLLQEISIKLGAANTVAVLLKGNGTGLINNVLLSRVQVNAPQGGTGITPAGRHQRHQALERRPRCLPAVRRRGRRRLVRGIQREPGRHRRRLRQQQLCRLLRPLPGHRPPTRTATAPSPAR